MAQNLQTHTTELIAQLNGLSIQKSLDFIANKYPGQVVFSTSFSFEDQLITHLIVTNNLPIFIFTLDTGRLFAETYSVWNSTNDRYQTKIKAYYPNHAVLEEFIHKNGPNAFYESVENRKQCCH